MSTARRVLQFESSPDFINAFLFLDSLGRRWPGDFFVASGWSHWSFQLGYIMLSLGYYNWRRGRVLSGKCTTS
jgi:hypothetical protein